MTRSFIDNRSALYTYMECENVEFYMSVYSGGCTILLPVLKSRQYEELILKAMVEVNELRNECGLSVKMHSCYVVVKEKNGFADKKNHATPRYPNQPDKDAKMRWD